MTITTEIAVLRYFFDPGSGVCLWAGNHVAKTQFGYAIDHWQLPLSENSQRWLQYLIAWFDTSINWDSPASLESGWSLLEQERFQVSAQQGWKLLHTELSSLQFVILDETVTNGLSSMVDS